MNPLINQNISLFSSNTNVKRAELLQYFTSTYELYEQLFDVLIDDTIFYQQPEKLRHPLIFYFGHTASFYVNKLVLANKVQRVNEYYESVFAIGVDEMSWDDLNGTNYKWPTVEQTREYRKQVKELVSNFIINEQIDLPISWDNSAWIVLMGIEHELIHLETSSVLIRQLDVNMVRNSPMFSACTQCDSSETNELLFVKGGSVELGKSHSDDFYGWDNEYGYFSTALEDFYASKHLVSNQDFLEFVMDNGYKSDQYWSDEGILWKRYVDVDKPTFWIKNKDVFYYRTLTSVIKMPLNWPVEVNYHEAKAYCNWLSVKKSQEIRLPTEAEWNRLAKLNGIFDFNSTLDANISLNHFASACPNNMFSQGRFFDIVGNVWQWCETAIYPFEGFKTHHIYDDFSAPTFDNRHNIIKGGSFISKGNQALPWSRYAFRRHFYQHAGFRYVASKNAIENSDMLYEIDRSIAQAIDLCYSEQPSWQLELSRLIDNFVGFEKRTSVLEIGCGVGRFSFELAKLFSSVIGIDFSARYIRCGEMIKSGGDLRYAIRLGNGQAIQKVITSNQLSLNESIRDKVKFWQADACNLKSSFTGYDLVISINALETMYNPKKFLNEIHSRISDKGYFVLCSTYKWSQVYCSKSEWLSEDNTTAFNSINLILSRNFTKIIEPICIDIPIINIDSNIIEMSTEVSFWLKK